MATTPIFSLRVSLAKHVPGDAMAIMDRISHPNETLRQALTMGLMMLATVAQKERFTGQGPFAVSENRLGIVSGRLRRDLHSEPATLTATGYSGRIGASVSYFGPHEIGFEGVVSVRAHSRAAHTLSERPIAGKNGKVRTRAAQSRLEQSVRAHKRKVKIPARRPLATAMEQHSVRVLGAAITKALKTLTTSD